MKRSVFVLIAGVLGACSTILGADFEDRPVPGKGTGGTQSTGGTTGGSLGGSSGTSTGGSAGGSGAGGSGTGGQGGTAGRGGSAGEGGSSGGTDPTGGTAGSAGSSDGGMGGEPEGGVVVLNEIKGQGDGDDYIEIYNRGPGIAELDGYGIADENNTFPIPSGTTLGPDEYLLLLLGRSDLVGEFTCFTPNPCFHASWGISQAGETVFLRDATSAVIDTTEYPDQTGPNGLANGQSWGRLPSGTGSFGATRLTPELQNQAP